MNSSSLFRSNDEDALNLIVMRWKSTIKLSFFTGFFKQFESVFFLHHLINLIRMQSVLTAFILDDHIFCIPSIYRIMIIIVEKRPPFLDFFSSVSVCSVKRANIVREEIKRQKEGKKKMNERIERDNYPVCRGVYLDLSRPKAIYRLVNIRCLAYK